MIVARTRTELADACRAGPPVALVPTMGALHSGHRALIREARRQAAAVVVSIFVNPLQFGPGEDLDRYPRTLASDLAACRDEGVAAVFVPTAEEMYGAAPPRVTVDPGPLGAELEGAVRPGHFAGVLTVVAKLLGIVRPEVAVFGEKDYQQLVLIRRLVLDLDLGARIVGVGTVRESDGLALSSRNRYLGPSERERAVALFRSLSAGANVAAAGSSPAEVLAAAERELARGLVATDYIVLRGAELEPAPGAGPARLLAAAQVGTTRLIDNIPVALRPLGVEAPARPSRSAASLL